MKHGANKLLSLLLCAAMVLTLLALPVYAQSGEEHDHDEHTEPVENVAGAETDGTEETAPAAETETAAPTEEVPGTADTETKPTITVIPDYSYKENNFNVTIVKDPTVPNTYCHGVTVYVTGAETVTVAKDGGQPEEKTSPFQLGCDSGYILTPTKYAITAGTETLEITVYLSHLIGGRDTYIGEDGKAIAVEKCRYCGALYDYIKPTAPSVSGDDAEHSYTTKTVEGTSSCDGRTYTIKVCSDCGFMKVEVSGESNSGTHTWVGKRNSATCKEYGVDYEECAVCGAVNETNIQIRNKTAHELSGSNVIYSYPDGDCTKADGTKSTVCGVCGETITEKLPKQSAHTLGWTITEKAPCGGEGKESGRCVNPGCQHTEGERTYQSPDKEHTWGTPVVLNAPTCGTPGSQQVTCTKCGTTETQEIEALAGEHVFTVETVDPTCIAPGQTTKTCTKCGTVVVEQIPIDDSKHVNPGDDENCETPVICTLCGATLTAAKTHALGAAENTNAEVHTRRCTNAGCNYTEETQHAGTDDGNCRTPMKCTECGRTIRPEYSFHKGILVPSPNNPENTHTYKCTHEGCEQYYGQINPHTFKDNVCTECGYDRTAHEHEPVTNSDSTGHWQECKICHVILEEVKPHSRTAQEGYEGTCTTAVTCKDCGYTILPAQNTHTFPSDWQHNDEYHYHKCTQNGCEFTENFEHDVTPDGDCTTDDVCAACGYVAVRGGAEHTMYLVEGSGTEEGHKRECTNPGCDHTDFISHDGSTQGTPATCTKKAACMYCGASYGELDPDNHDGERLTMNYREPTYEEEGYSGDIYCMGCDQMIEEGHALPKREHGNDHIYDGDYSYDDEKGHYRVCSICGTRDETSFEEHTYAYEDKGDGSHTKRCTLCGYEKVEDHIYEDDHNCTTEVKCQLCEAVVIEASAGHSFNGRAVPGEGGHQVACTNRDCTAMSDIVPHTGGQANCQTSAHCEVCNAEYGEKDPDVHVGGTEIRDHKDPTETEKGYTGDTYCAGCGALLEKGHELDMLPPEHEHSYDRYDHDETGHWKECACGAFTDREPHTYGAYQSDDDHHWKECVCGWQTEVGPHTYVDGKCVCGKVQASTAPDVDPTDPTNPADPTEPTVTPPATEPGTPGDTPKTGDTALPMLIAALLISFAGGSVLLTKKESWMK